MLPLLQQQTQKQKLVRDAIAGCAAGVTSAVVVCPLDVVKARLQLSSASLQATTATAATTATTATTAVLAAIWRTEGLRGWYRGLAATTACYVPSWGIYFATYRACRDADADDDARMSPWAAAAAAGIASTVLTNPLWVVRARIVARPEPMYPSFRAGLRALPRASYAAGLAPSLLGVAHVVIQLPLYERLRDSASASVSASASASAHARPTAGSVIPAICTAKLVATGITYPHEVIRTRVQNGQFSSIRSCLRGLYVIAAAEAAGAGASAVTGFLRLMYRGFGTHVLRTLPSACVTFYTFETISYALMPKHIAGAP